MFSDCGRLRTCSVVFGGSYLRPADDCLEVNFAMDSGPSQHGNINVCVGDDLLRPGCACRFCLSFPVRCLKAVAWHFWIGSLVCILGVAMKYRCSAPFWTLVNIMLMINNNMYDSVESVQVHFLTSRFPRSNWNMQRHSPVFCAAKNWPIARAL